MAFWTGGVGTIFCRINSVCVVGKKAPARLHRNSTVVNVESALIPVIVIRLGLVGVRYDCVAKFIFEYKSVSLSDSHPASERTIPRACQEASRFLSISPVSCYLICRW